MEALTDAQPSRVNHTHRYDGTAGAITVNVCAETAAASLVPEIHSAIQFWNTASPQTNNCVGTCQIEGEPPAIPDAVHRGDTIAHELAHCAYGITHPNREGTSFTKTRDFTAMNPGGDGIEGTKDDDIDPLPGARLLHRFVRNTNDPFDELAVVDKTNFTRLISDLSISGSAWPANANRKVGNVLNYVGKSQSIMYSLASSNTQYLAPVADDLNTIKFAMSGLNELVGTDDYTVQLAFVSDCSVADVKVEYIGLGPTSGIYGICDDAYVPLPIPDQILNHYALSTSVLYINSDLGQGRWVGFLLLDGFDSGDTSRWSATVP